MIAVYGYENSSNIIGIQNRYKARNKKKNECLYRITFYDGAGIKSDY